MMTSYFKGATRYIYSHIHPSSSYGIYILPSDSHYYKEIA